MSMGARRHRITLMKEVMLKGAGGRLTRARPIIADVWAEASLSGTATQGDGGASLREKASFTAAYHRDYLEARYAEWDGNLFRIEAYRLSGTTTRLVSFDASRLEG